jgi:hypothetical protein
MTNDPAQSSTKCCAREDHRRGRHERQTWRASHNIGRYLPNGYRVFPGESRAH